MDATPAPGRSSAPHPGFRRSVAAFARLGVTVTCVGPDPGLPDAHPIYRAIVHTIRDAQSEVAALLEDASLLDRASYELGLFARLLRTAMAAEPPVDSADADANEATSATAPSVRLVRTRWDWDAFLADPALALPPESGAAWVLVLAPNGPVQMRRLHALPALLLEACAYPLTRAQAVAAVTERVEADPAQLAPVVQAQIDELLAAGLLRPSAPTAADHTINEMRQLLLAVEPPHPARGIAGLLARATRATRKHAAAAVEAADPAYPAHVLDLSVSRIEQLLAAVRLRDAFHTELDGYWASGDVEARVGAVTPLLETLRRALGEGMHALPAYVHP